ncbi:MAG: hypothetical protein KF779_12645 [Hyphomonadaceae bacterium]|nr:hypothetical protein [Hyphomonadaceae bacterium]MCA8885312.1 hypothetical protein [Hyphomonadaceae bacterium]
MNYQTLDPARIIATLDRLRDRITRRFPESGLSQVSEQLAQTARRTHTRAVEISANNWPLRFAVTAIIVGGAAAIVWAVRLLHIENVETNVGLLQTLEAAVNLVILFGGATWFLVGLDDRLKRQRALEQLHTLRSMAHVVDMHQLTKDPYAITLEGEASLTPQELARYLDYCAEMLALIAKLAALYADRVRDPVVIDAVTEVENLTTGLSRKIWQKISLIANVRGDAAT